VINMMPLMLDIVLGTPKGDIWLALLLFLAVVTFAWAKGKLGDAYTAIAFVLILGLVFISHTEFVWVVVGVWLLKEYGLKMFKV